jgi:hypothetical protein
MDHGEKYILKMVDILPLIAIGEEIT